MGQKINKHGMEGIKPPIFYLPAIIAFFDFKMATKAIFPHKANYIVAVDGFINREGNHAEGWLFWQTEVHSGLGANQTNQTQSFCQQNDSHDLPRSALLNDWNQ